MPRPLLGYLVQLSASVSFCFVSCPRLNDARRHRCRREPLCTSSSNDENDVGGDGEVSEGSEQEEAGDGAEAESSLGGGQTQREAALRVLLTRLDSPASKCTVDQQAEALRVALGVRTDFTGLLCELANPWNYLHFSNGVAADHKIEKTAWRRLVGVTALNCEFGLLHFCET